MKYTYSLEVAFCGRWIKFKSGSLQYLKGHLDGKAEASPRIAHRIVRSDGKIVEELPARDDVGIGLVAGHPTAEQYERAAEKALAKAEAIREFNRKSFDRP
jgi:hypothetical protein